jgi:hypothetical protein
LLDERARQELSMHKAHVAIILLATACTSAEAVPIARRIESDQSHSDYFSYGGRLRAARSWTRFQIVGSMSYSQPGLLVRIVR